ncbi:hypothetical protein [Arthrobacter woluwensis]|uniref:Uncharacterized protein n=1 Tax=Arthrobacter woluwensis TaxID=156980 RepID=A0A1H4WT65_9MICC|nr:hypothetical protein [Arthrobacter woluwensis]SEC89872.1 hypothetical protein SAMN04489745_3457 [Arthrobacter woluwensis]SEC95754.1 hypothetical protein SAMN04489745_3547 [Arthrobacter woluwensis]
MNPDHLESAVENVAEYYGCDMDEARTAINRALPHLRKAIIQELINEADATFERDEDLPVGSVADFAAQWLRAKLKEAENGDESSHPIPDHEFQGVYGHPDDDECTHRSDGTDLTYCGEPRKYHDR